jgi:hypothetical protein
MSEPEKKSRGLLSRPLFWLATLILAGGAAAFFSPIWTCPLCQGIEVPRITSRPTRPCMVCDGAKKVSLRPLLEKMIR